MALEKNLNMDMKDYKEYIDNEMMVTMAQMDKPSKIFDYLFLVRETPLIDHTCRTQQFSRVLCWQDYLMSSLYQVSGT